MRKKEETIDGSNNRKTPQHPQSALLLGEIQFSLFREQGSILSKEGDFLTAIIPMYIARIAP